MMNPLHALTRSLLRRPWLALAILLPLGLLSVVGGTVGGREIWAEYHYRAALRALERSNAHEPLAELSQARGHLEKCLQIRPDSAQTLLLAARAARRADDYDAAESHLRQCQKRGGVAEAIALERVLIEAQR